MKQPGVLITSVLLMLCIFLSQENAVAAPCLDADLIVRKGHIVTMDSAHRSVAAMAIRDGRILAVGSEQELAACVSARTSAVDLHGRTVLPGLIDVHTHAME